VSPALLERYGIFAALLLLLLAAAVFAPEFFGPSNLANVLRTASVLGIVAIGQTFVILGAGIDLSVGAVMGAAMIIAAQLTGGQDQLAVPAFVLALAMGAGVGLLNGLLVTGRNVPPFVATLAMLVLVEGARLAYTRGIPSGGIPPLLRVLGRDSLELLPLPLLGPISLRVPISLLVMIAVAVVAGLMLYRTPFGRALYATGGNREAARLSGIPVERVVTTTYVMCGCLAALGGLLLSGYVGYVDRYLGRGFDLDSIAAVVVGGTSFAGGRGGIGGTIAGVLLVTSLLNMVLILNLTAELQPVVKGLAIVGAVALYSVWRGR
jgi:ribose/xylose/arabinose/galactoside ABC-type transport system permease subunit